MKSDIIPQEIPVKKRAGRASLSQRVLSVMAIMAAISINIETASAFRQTRANTQLAQNSAKVNRDITAAQLKTEASIGLKSTKKAI